jgi:Flp pilus assembly protein TadG
LDAAGHVSPLGRDEGHQLTGTRHFDFKEGGGHVCDFPARIWRRLRLRSDSGSATIETAISLSILFSLSFWLFEMSFFTYTYAVLDEAAHEGIRYAIVHGSNSSNCSGPTTGCTDTTGANVSTVVKTVAKNSFHNISVITVTVTYPNSSAAPGSQVNISISYPYVPFFKLPGFSQTATVSAEGRIVF